MLAVQLLARDMYGGMTFNLEFKEPAAYCLLAWGQNGIEALADNALQEPTSKNFSLAFRMLASIAGNHEPPTLADMYINNNLRQVVCNAVNGWDSLADPARSHLHRLMLTIEDDDDAALYAATSLQGLALLDYGVARNLVHALALRSIAVGPRVLATYEKLLVERAKDEPVFHNFFESHPLLLDPRAFEVWSKPDFHGWLEPDFIIRTYENKYIVVEIETPAKALVTGKFQLSAAATHAVTQILQYQEYLNTHIPAASEAFPQFANPVGLVVIGRESSLRAGQKAVLRLENLSRPGITIVGFDTLAATAKANTNNIIHGIPKAITGMRLQ